MRNQSKPGKETCAGSLRPITFVFSCGCELPISEIFRNRDRTVHCINHFSATIKHRHVNCIDCGVQLTIAPSGRPRLRCDSCRKKKKRLYKRESMSFRRIEKSSNKIKAYCPQCERTHTAVLSDGFNAYKYTGRIKTPRLICRACKNNNRFIPSAASASDPFARWGGHVCDRGIPVEEKEIYNKLIELDCWRDSRRRLAG